MYLGLSICIAKLRNRGQMQCKKNQVFGLASSSRRLQSNTCVSPFCFQCVAACKEEGQGNRSEKQSLSWVHQPPQKGPFLRATNF